MLKIKNNVELKELEKLGFKYHKEQRNHYEHYALMEKTSRFSTKLYAVVYCEDRIIHKGTWTDSEEYATILFDLIQADLVEKVEGE